MDKFYEYPSYIYGGGASSSYGTAGRHHKAVRTQKAIASEVAVGDRSYYGIFRPINEPDVVADDHQHRYYNCYDTTNSRRNGLQQYLRCPYNNYGTLNSNNNKNHNNNNSNSNGLSIIHDTSYSMYDTITTDHRHCCWRYQHRPTIEPDNKDSSNNNNDNKVFIVSSDNNITMMDDQTPHDEYFNPDNDDEDRKNVDVIGGRQRRRSSKSGGETPDDFRGNRYDGDNKVACLCANDQVCCSCYSCSSQPPLQLQLFISSLASNNGVDSLSYGSVDTTGANGDFEFSRPNDIYHPPNLNATPMGSTTKLITADSGSAYRWKCCTAKCFPIFGTIFMTLSLTVSLGNILRLPTAVYAHGGGAFLVAYITIAILLGVPLLFLEITLGQFCQQGTTKLWRAVPLFKGVGFAKILSCILVGFYYPILVVSTLVYAAWSIIKPMPTSQCVTRLLPRYTGKEESMMNNPFVAKICSTKNETESDIFDNELTWFGGEIVFLFAFWIIIILSVFKSANSYRMSACIIVPVSLFITITLFAESMQRSTTGLKYLTNIRWESLLSFELWYHALIQFFFSTHVGFGNITTCAGRLYPKNNPFWTSVSFIFVNMVIGISFVCVVYMWIGDLIAASNTVHIPESQELFVITLIYDVTSECYGKFAHIWAAVVFLLIVLAGLTSMISLIYTIIVGIMVETKTKLSWWLVTVIVCFAGFIITSCCILPENFGATKLLDNYVVGKVVITTTVLEVIGFIWVYGLEALANDFEFVLGYKLNFIWKSLWFLAPLIISAAEIWSWFTLSMEDAFHHKSDETWLYMIGWLVYLFVWSIIIGIAVWQITSQVDYNIAQKFISAIKPSRNWGPVDPIYRHCWVQWRKQYQATGERDFTLKRRGTRDYTHSVKRGKHAGPVGMQYSVNPPSNQNTLQYKMDRENSSQISHSNVNTITSYSTWASCNTVNTYTK